MDVAVCSICGEALPGLLTVRDASKPATCGDCRQQIPVFAKAAAYGSYEGGLRDLIHLLKYQRIKPAAAVLGRMLSEVIQGLAPDFSSAAPIMVPVPLHPSKLRERGFNQSEMIAAAAAKLKPGGIPLSVQATVLERRRPTASQTGLTEHQRRENMRGAFTVARSDLIDSREVLLVDDVFTTGATVSECARVLRRAGASRVWVVTVARTMKSEAAYAVVSEAPEEESLGMAAHG